MRFKIGDRVVVTNIDNIDNPTVNISVGEKGVIVNIFETHSDRPYLIKFDRYVDGVYGIDKTSKVELSGHGWFMNENEIEIIEEEIKLKFNIGDRVMFADKYGGIDYGKVGTIVDINEDLAHPYLVEFDEYVNGHDGNGYTETFTKDGHGWYVDDLEIDFVEEAEVLDFKIGDRVIVAKNIIDKGAEKIKKGTTGTVVGMSNSGTGNYLVEFDEHINGHDGNGLSKVKTKDGHGWYVSSNNIMLLDEEVNDLKFNIGDRVVYVDKFGAIEYGKIGTVVGVDKNLSLPYLIEFDEYVNGHDGNGFSKTKTKDGHGWYVNSDEMELLDSNEKRKSIFDDICKRLGVKLDEVWVANNGYKYKITETGIHFYNNNTKEWYEIFAPDYRDIVKGKVFPTEMWVPEIGELVYLISPELHTGVSQILYNGSIEHERLYERGFIYEDEEQAKNVVGMIVEEFGR